MNEVLFENIISYGSIAVVMIIIMFFYLRSKSKTSKSNIKKIAKAKEHGFHEPVTLHPVINPNTCIGSGACIEACPEHDILGIVNGRSTTVNASRCVGHGACFHACPVDAITLFIGTEKRGVDLPHVSQQFETNIPMLYIAGELGGMGLIKNAVAQGSQAVTSIAPKLKKTEDAEVDIIIVGAGPAGISASLAAKEKGLTYHTFEQDTLGGTVYSFPRAKLVMTSPMQLPLYGKVKLTQTSKSELLTLWNDVITKNEIKIREQEKVNKIEKINNIFNVVTNKGNYTSRSVLLAIGRRGSPRKLGVKGENREKVYYRLLEPELFHNLNILVVGGGDSAIESALLLVDEKNKVTISYRAESFSRIKPMNLEKITKAIENRKIEVIFNSTVEEIFDDSVLMNINTDKSQRKIDNDFVYVFAGGELPTQFLESIGIKITRKFGEAILSHKKN